MSMSMWRLILIGGSTKSTSDPDDLHGRASPGIVYERNGAWLVISALLLFLLVPLIILPSSIGSIPYQYSPDFLSQTYTSKYWTLVIENGLMVLDYLGLKVSGDVPKPPAGLLGHSIMVLIALSDLLAACMLGLGVKNIYRNISTWRKHQEG